MSDLELIGVSIVGPPPLGAIHLPFVEGVSAFYGLNGVGKSSLLRGIRSALQGSSNDGLAAVHIRIRDHTEDPPALDLAYLTEILDDAMVFRSAAVLEGDPGGEADFESARGDAGPDHPSSYAYLLTFLSEWGDKEVSAEIRASGLFTLVASGNMETPSWTVFAGVRLGSESPQITQRLDEILGINRPIDAGPFGVDFFSDLPPWVPAPLVFGGVWHLRAEFPRVLGDLESRDPNDLPNEILGGDWGDEPLLVQGTGAIEVNSRVLDVLDELATEASTLLSDLLEDAPELTIDVSPPAEWLSRRGACWVAKDRAADAWVPLGKLSEAQRRWATLAIWASASVVDGEENERIGAVLIDEPEAALHPRAQRFAIEGIKRLSKKTGASVMAATHSPILLSDPDIRLIHVTRDWDGLTKLEILDSDARARLDPSAFGVSVSDLLQSYRVFLLVEGEHDIAVLEGVLGDEWGKARTLILAMRGADHAVSAADGRVLLDFTDGYILVLLDGVDLETYRPGWDEARALSKVGKDKAAMNALKGMEVASTHEGMLIHEVCRRAVETRRADRIEIFGLRARDVIDYLPPHHFVAGAGNDWGPLNREYRDYRGSGGDITFKRWLVEHKRAQVSVDTIRSAAESLDHIPEEFSEILSLCRRLSAGT